MKNEDNWNSQFRKQRFYKNQMERKEKKLYQYEKVVTDSPKRREKIITILLDLQGTCNFIDNDKAKYFIKQINKIKNKFMADSAIICISTHDPDSRGMKKVFDIIRPHLPSHTKIGTSFFYEGTYDYNTDTEICRKPSFNSHKLDTFKDYYINNPHYQIKWFAFIDDGATDTIYKEFQQQKPMLLCKPSQSEAEIYYNNFMRIATTTYGFDGVIECLDKYIDSIRGLTPSEIFTKQKNMIRHLSRIELGDKVLERDFIFLKEYFDSGFADQDDYNDVLQAILVTLERLEPSYEEREVIHNILTIISAKFNENKDEKRLRKVKLLRDEFKL